jgi:hypothetical protein
MAVLRRRTEAEITRERELTGEPHPDQFLPVPDFTYSFECLAQMIVDVWQDSNYYDALITDRDAEGLPTEAATKLATDSVNSCGFNLQRAVVISEDEYYAGYTVDQDDPEIVFVLPNLNRVRLNPTGRTLLETAKLLMATTPNGI